MNWGLCAFLVLMGIRFFNAVNEDVQDEKPLLPALWWTFISVLFETMLVIWAMHWRVN